MARKKQFDADLDELEELKKENRQLKSTIKALQKALKKLSRGKDRLQDLEEMFKELSEENEDLKNPVVDANKCPSCAKGKLKLTPLGAKTLETCTNCKHRKLL